MLPIDVVELHAEVGSLLQDVAAEKIYTLVIRCQDFPFLGLGHGCQLMHIADHQELHAAKGFLRPSRATQHGIDGIKHIGADHADLVNDKQVEAAHDVQLCFSDFLVL